MASPFVHVVRPRFAEIDMQGVVFNAHWLTYFDDACTRFFEHLVGPAREVFLESGFDCMLVKAVLEWKGPAGFDEEVAIAVAPVRLGTASFDLRYEAAVGERPACEGLIMYVSVRHGTHDSQPIPEPVRARLEQCLA